MLTSFTLVGPLGLPWWVPLVGIPVIALAAPACAAWRSARAASCGAGWPCCAARAAAASSSASCSSPSWPRSCATGSCCTPSASTPPVFDAIAVLIAVVTLGQLPVGPSVGAASAVLILGHDGVAAVAAAGLLLTATGTIGGLGFAAWAGLDRLGAAWWGAASGRPPGAGAYRSRSAMIPPTPPT